MGAQTVDWSQIKASDRLGSGPMGQSTSSGPLASKPATCSVGQMYFANDASAGLNLLFCTATNTWTQMSVGNVTVSGGYAIIQVGGTPVTSEGTLNLIGGSGGVVVCVDNPGATRTDCTLSTNFTTVLSIHAAQSGVTYFCSSTNGTTALTCSFNNTGGSLLTAYTKGMMVLVTSTTSSITSGTLDIDSLGPHSLKRSDCTTDIGTDLVANGGILFWYNGANFCEMLPSH